MMIATLSRFEVCKAVAYHVELRDPAQKRNKRSRYLKSYSLLSSPACRHHPSAIHCCCERLTQAG